MDINSDEHRHACEVRQIAALAPAVRKEHMLGILKQRGDKAALRIMVDLLKQGIELEPHGETAKQVTPHNVRDTSMAAHQKLVETGALGKQERIVLEFIRTQPRPVTRQEITSALRIGINAVCGRVNSLVEKQMLEECGTRNCSKTGQRVNILRAR